MISFLRLASLVMFVGCCCCQAQVVGTVQDFRTNGWAKAENGLVISWQLESEDAKETQVAVSDSIGRPVTSLKLLGIVPDAAKAYVYDVSARPNGIIAVAAVYVSKLGDRSVRPASTLLLFDLSGHLLSFLSLARWRDIERLEVDEQSNIWTLTWIAEEGKDPARYSMLVEYTAKGEIARESLPRSLFPLHAEETRGSSRIGFPAMGYDSRVVWFWLPGSTDFVTVPVDGSSPSLFKTGLPKESTSPVNIARQNSGDLVGEFREAQKSHSTYYKWSLSTKAWAPYKPGACEGGWLVSSDGKEVYLTKNPAKPSNIDICTFGTQ
jgi:hypothetical protein